jgi:urease accessory protein
MLTANKLVPRGQGLAPILLKRAASLELDWDTRQKSRFQATDSQGREVGVFLPRGTVVRGGDVLVVEDGSLVRVVAAPQSVLVITHCSQHGTPFDLIRAAYHLGNRHVQIELTPTHLKIEPDHVLADMLRAMHLIVNERAEAFEPEAGAYAAGHGHTHGHGHAAHDHAHDHDSGHPHHPGHAHGHDHGHGHDRDHDHGHDHSHDHSHGAAPAPGHDHGHGHGHGHAHGSGGHDGHGHDHGHGHSH